MQRAGISCVWSAQQLHRASGPGRSHCRARGLVTEQLRCSPLGSGDAVACGVGDADNPPVSISPKHLQILYQDDVLAVVDKPAGLMVHDSKLARGEDDFLADRLREQLGKPIFLVHRLDRATSGCLLLAFDRDSASALGKALMAGEVEKDYLTVCRGWPRSASSSTMTWTAGRASRSRSRP